MESDRFDRLVKSLASVDTRRGLLRLLLSGSLAAGLATGTRRRAGRGATGRRSAAGGGHGASRSGMTLKTRRTGGSASGSVRTDEMTLVAWPTPPRARPACRSISSAIPTHRSAAAGRP
jgi:hypothetical protein